jgi:hypothetical protein
MYMGISGPAYRREKILKGNVPMVLAQGFVNGGPFPSVMGKEGTMVKRVGEASRLVREVAGEDEVVPCATGLLLMVGFFCNDPRLARFFDRDEKVKMYGGKAFVFSLKMHDPRGLHADPFRFRTSSLRVVVTEINIPPVGRKDAVRFEFRAKPFFQVFLYFSKKDWVRFHGHSRHSRT